MSFGLLRKNKNKPGSKFLPARMTVLGFLLPKAGLQPAQRASCSWGAGKAPGPQALVATAAKGHFPLGLRVSTHPPLVKMSSWGNVSQGAQEIPKKC